MSRYKWPLPDLLFRPQRVKDFFFFFWCFWHTLLPPPAVQGKARRTHPEHRQLPAAAGGRLAQPAWLGSLAPGRLLELFQAPTLSILAKGIFEEGHCEVEQE